MSVLANNFKMKFAGLLRGLLRRVDGNENAESQTVRPVAAANLQQPAMVPPVAPVQPPSATMAPPPARTPNASELEMPLLPILEKLPPDLRSKWTTGGVNLEQASICIAVEKVLPQLALGAVKITFGELRQAAPQLFRTGEQYDSLPIMLPLNDVLARLNPALLPRNSGQRTVAAPTDIAGPFGTGTQGVTFANTLLKQAPVTPTPATTHFFRKPAPESEPVKPQTPIPVIAPPPPSIAQRATTPSPSIPAAVPAPPNTARPVPTFQMPFTPRPTVPQSPPSPPPAAPAIPVSRPAPPVTSVPASNAPVPAVPNLPIPNIFVPNAPAPNIPAPNVPVAKVPVPNVPVQNAPIPSVRVPNSPISNAPVQNAPIAKPASPEVRIIQVPLSALMETWPDALRQEVIQSNMIAAQVALPGPLIEAALKRGRVAFPWQLVRSWIKPTPPGTSAQGEAEVELPLRVIAPLFMPRQKVEVKSQAKPAVPPGSIPNLFFGFPQPQPEELVAPINAPDVVPPAKPVDAKLAETNFFVWGDNAETPRIDETDYKRPKTPATDFTTRRSMPNDVINRAMGLPGVVGAIIALPDGLKVAHNLPADLNPDTVAAFLPQLFSRVSQCSKELRMGELNNLNFTIGNIPWKIFRVNAVYFAAFGRAGEPLPTPQLAMLAAELDQKK